jgi:hypothetical protein
MPTPTTVGLLPQCLNTWMFQANCKDNKEFTCYCKNPELITNVMGCVKAWAKDESDAKTAASFLMGLCAPFVPQNPAIITAYGTMNSNSSAPKTSEDSHIPFATTVPVESTKTFYSSHVVTITSCAPTITNCPANSIVVKTKSTPVSYQTFTSSQVSVDAITQTSALKTDAPGQPIVTTSAVTEWSTFASTMTSDSKTTIVTTSVATRTQTKTITLPPTQKASITGDVDSIPSTTIVISTTLMVPCTYTNGESAGLPIPSSSTVSSLVTSVTVPQVALATDAPSSNGDDDEGDDDNDDEPDVGLVYGPPPADITSNLPMTTPALPTWAAVATGYGRNNASGNCSRMASTARASTPPSTAGYASPSSSAAGQNSTITPHTGAAIKASGLLDGGIESTFLVGFVVVVGMFGLAL